MTRQIAVLACCMFIMTLTLGCAGGASTDQAAEPTTATAPAGDSAAMPAGVEMATGTVVETMEAANYTYIRVDTGSGDVWAAANHFDVAVGDRVSVPLEMPMENFHSDSLDRDFPLIYFTSQVLPEGATPQAAMPAGHPNVTTVDPAVDADTIEPAEGGLTVAEVWADRASLVGKEVTVRGKVVKFNGGILGTNWIHLQDGSGDATAGTHDLAVTTDANAAVGDVVTVTGTLATDKDFGAGYSYAVILENATATK